MISKRHRTEPEKEENQAEEELKRKRQSKNQSCFWNLNFSLFCCGYKFFSRPQNFSSARVKSETKTETEPKQEQVQKVCDGVCLCVFVSCLL